jgi:L-gulono-1,4-lactone dehydrogenase
VRMVGAGHAFTDVALTDGILLNSARLRAPLRIDPDARTVTVGAGTTVRQLNSALAGQGFALSNMCHDDAQTVAGAISTGSHGSGRDSASLSTQVRALELVRADGSQVTCSRDAHSDLFRAAAVGMGAFGIIVSITLEVEPAFLLKAREETMPLDAVLDNLDGLIADNDHFECFWFPHTDQTLTKQSNRSAGPRKPSSRSAARVGNAMLSLLERAGRTAPSYAPSLNRIRAGAVSNRTYTDASYAVLTGRRGTGSLEMEYALPRTAAVNALREVRALIDASPWRLSLPIEIRVGPADDLWLSTAYDRDCVYLTVRSLARTPYQSYFRAVEAIAVAYSGRPHWGKLHNRSAADLAGAYPRWEDVRRARDDVDPDRRFGNAYLARVLGS